MRSHRDDEGSASIPRVPLWRRYLHFWRTDVAADVDEELRFHLDERVAALLACGLTPADAHARALAEFGDVDEVRATLRGIGEQRERRHARASRWEAFAYDVRLAWRAVRGARGLSAAIIVTLALGLGANVAVFTLLDRLLLRVPSGVHDPDGVRRLFATRAFASGSSRSVGSSFNYAELLDMRRATGRRALMAAYSFPRPLRLGQGPDAPAIHVSYANSDYFTLLGAQPVLGRPFSGDEDRVEVEPVHAAILGYALWQSRFGGDSSIIDRTIVLDRARFNVVGVAPPGFVGDDIDAIDAWVPLGLHPTFPRASLTESRVTRRGSSLSVLMRVGVGEDERAILARATNAIRHGDRTVDPSGYFDTTATVLSGPVITALGPGQLSSSVSAGIRVGVVALAVLLIACANVTNLLLARAQQRRREIAVRLALGVSRGRLVLQLLLEGLLLAALAGVAALVVGSISGDVLRTTLMPDRPMAGSTLDLRVVIASSLLALGAGVLATIAPALIASRPDLTSFLKLGHRGGVLQRSRLRAGLIVAQAAISVALLAGAALFLRTMANLRAVDVGYDVSQIVFGNVSYSTTGDSPLTEMQQRQRLARTHAGLARVEHEIGGLPGVEHTARAWMMPFMGWGVMTLSIPGRDSLPGLRGDYPTYVAVSPDFFTTTGLAIHRGRAFTDADDAGAAHVVVVNETMARTFWPDKDAIGNCLLIRETGSSCTTVVGVSADAHRGGVIESQGMIYYLPLSQMPLPQLASGETIVFRTKPQVLSSVSAALARSLWKEFNADAETRSFAMDELLARQYDALRGATRLFTALAVLALLVAASGIYATVAHGVSQRRHELGVRVALGARATDIVRLVVRGGLETVALGVLVGVALALAGGRLVASMLYGISANDPRVLVSVSLVLLLMALLASALPAWRAARTDPLEALRAE